jgi:hypothetical protein
MDSEPNIDIYDKTVQFLELFGRKFYGSVPYKATFPMELFSIFYYEDYLEIYYKTTKLDEIQYNVNGALEFFNAFMNYIKIFNEKYEAFSEINYNNYYVYICDKLREINQNFYVFDEDVLYIDNLALDILKFPITSYHLICSKLNYVYYSIAHDIPIIIVNETVNVDNIFTININSENAKNLVKAYTDYNFMLKQAIYNLEIEERYNMLILEYKINQSMIIQ